MPILTVNGTKPIGAAADKIESESERAPASASVVDTCAGGSGMAAETAKTPMRREPRVCWHYYDLRVSGGCADQQAHEEELSLEIRAYLLVSCRVS
ncbi:MAG: hypothetical protein U9N36_02310 [Euryarchaeota archaeon]|nr:hypothetical protein [Euryarchaeota archaeon]